MINNNEEWKEIEISEQNKKADIIDKYGFDIYEKFKKQNSKEAIRKRIIIKRATIIISIVIIITILVSSWSSSIPQIIVESYIKYNDNFILPHNASIQTDDEIRKSAKEQFLSIK